MDRHSRRVAACALAAACLGLGFAPAAQAYTFVTTDIIDFNLTESISQYNGGQQFRVSPNGDGDGTVNYRWVDVPPKTTVISANACGNLALLGSHQYNAGITDYRELFAGGFQSECFILRGRTAAGSGSMTNYDGRLQR
jgi:hypothetical protein